MAERENIEVVEMEDGRVALIIDPEHVGQPTASGESLTIAGTHGPDVRMFAGTALAGVTANISLYRRLADEDLPEYVLQARQVRNAALAESRKAAAEIVAAGRRAAAQQ